MRSVFAASTLLLLASITSASADDRVTIRALWDEATVALCGGNWARYESFWAASPDIELMHPGQHEWLVGWDAIGSKYKRMLGSGFRCEAVTRTMRIHVAPGREMAWATAEVALRLPNQPETILWDTAVFEKRGGRWRLVHAHTSRPDTPSAEAVADRPTKR